MGARKRKGNERSLQVLPAEAPRTAVPWFLLLPFFLSGATSLALEVAWSKELSYLLGVDLYGSATVVTAYMAGIGLGAYLSARLPHGWRISEAYKEAGIVVSIGINELMKGELQAIRGEHAHCRARRRIRRRGAVRWRFSLISPRIVA